jgi:hypothetical protein
MSIVLVGSTSGSVTLQEPAVAGSTVLDLPAASGTVMVSGNMPAFSAYQSSAQTLSANTATKLTFTTEEFDTNNNFASSTFTPTVNGYYLITAGMEFSTAAAGAILYIYKNGSLYKKFTNTNPALVSGLNGSGIVSCNGSTDYVEIYGFTSVGQALVASSASTYFQACLIRTA